MVIRNDTSFIDKSELQAKLDEEKESHIVDKILNFLNIINVTAQISKHEK